MAVPSFVDRVTLHVSAGRGGHGVASVHREKFKPLGGPDGGNGGQGGSVILRVESDVTTLVDYHHSPKRRAENGGQGAGGHKNGGHGADIVLSVPDGTVVSSGGEVLADMVGPGSELVVAQGGRGGLGNAALASSKRKAPGFALLGEPGDELEIQLELKVVADVGLVGFPSAGKSSLIASISRARPKIADYPFTTLVPNLGVVSAGDVTYTVADVPGLIEGASDGRGLGHDFLRHVERCAALVHVLDTATMEPGRNPVDDLDVIERELERYGGLEDRPRLVALNKIDVPDGRDISEMVVEDLRARGLQVFPVSAASGEGTRQLVFAMAEIVQAARAEREVAAAQRIVLRPPASTGPASSPSSAPPTAGGCAAPSPSAGCGRPTSATTRPWASSPTGSTGSVSRRGCWSWARRRATPSSSGTPTTPSSSTSVRTWTPAPRTSPAVARTSGSTRSGRPPVVAARSTRTWTSAARARPAPTSPAGSTRRRAATAWDRRRTRSGRPTTPTGPRTTLVPGEVRS